MAPVAVGAAFHLDEQVHLYSETHCSSGDALAREVIYRDTEDRLLAHKVLDYRAGPATPSFEQRNAYSGESIAVAAREDGVEMTVTDSAGAARTVTATADARLPLVIDAGFDAFVRENWAALVAGEDRRFQFPVAAREDLVNLRITAARCSYAAAGDQCFRLELDNWALRLLVEPIELGYDAASKRLLRYRGVSNIGDENGEGQAVDIRYAYEQLPAGSCDAEPLRQDATLSGRS